MRRNQLSHATITIASSLVLIACRAEREPVPDAAGASTAASRAVADSIGSGR